MIMEVPAQTAEHTYKIRMEMKVRFGYNKAQ